MDLLASESSNRTNQSSNNILILSTVYPIGKQDYTENIVHGKFVHDLAKTLVKSGVQVHVATPHSKKTLSFETMDGVHIHRFHYFFHWRLETLTYGKGIPENIKRFKNKLLVPFLSGMFLLKALFLIKKYKIEVINPHWIVPGGYLGAIIKELTACKLVATAYGAELFPVLNGKMKFLVPYIKKAAKKADAVVGISSATVEAVKKISGRNDIHLIPDGIDTDYYKPGPKNIKLLQEYSIEPDEKCIFFTGRMVERKGHIHLLKAFHALSEQRKKVKLLLGGKGPKEKELLEYRARYSLENRVIMPGFLPEEHIVPLLQSADVYVLPSCIDGNGDTEGSATAALEAMACGTPAIISKVGGNIGAIEDGKGAFYFEPENLEELLTKMIGLIDNNSIGLIQNEARRFIKKYYNWKYIGDDFKRLI